MMSVLSASKDAEKLSLSYTAGRNVKQYSHCGKQFVTVFKNQTYFYQISQEFHFGAFNPEKWILCPHNILYMIVRSSFICKSKTGNNQNFHYSR